MSYNTKRNIGKAIKITIAVLFLLALLWGIMFTVEITTCAKPHLPIFARYTHTTGEYGTIHHYQGLGYTVTVYGNAPFDSEYDFEAIEITILNGESYYAYFVHIEREPIE